MSDLRIAGLIESQRGKPNPKLTKEPNEISLLDIYASVEKISIFTCGQKTNPNCLIGEYPNGIRGNLRCAAKEN